jgi:ABC-type Co2+ transport system permease subunit
MYSPYTLAQAVPVMLLSHGLGASFVEAAVTVLGLAYMRRLYPGLLPRREAPHPGPEPAREPEREPA